jgi:hypothetical protein
VQQRQQRAAAEEVATPLLVIIILLEVANIEDGHISSGWEDDVCLRLKVRLHLH